MAARCVGEEALAAKGAAIEACHIGFRTRFIDKDEASRVDVIRLAPPPPAPTSYVRSFLLIGPQRFF
jgi:hypothetical protein